MIYYSQMKKQDINICLLDEEGGIFPGSAEPEWRERLLARFDLSKLDDNDRIFSWGNWQADAYANKKPDAPIAITGSPSFDVLQRKYGKSLENFDRLQTKGLKNYVLINTRFSSSNGLRPMKWVLSNQGPNTSLAGEVLADEIINDGTMQYHMTALVKKLSYQLPEENFIIRPHPAEDSNFYQDIFQYTKNVHVLSDGDVSSWIRRAKALIHFGCTTAIQADIYGADVITYAPKTLGLYEGPALPNLVGAICETYEEVYDALINQNKPNSRPVWEDTISELDSIDAISLICQKMLSNKNIPNLSRSLKVHFFIYKMKRKAIDFLRLFYRKRYLEHQLNIQKFDYNFFSLSTEIFNGAKSYYNADITLKAKQSDYFIIEPNQGKGSVLQSKV
jgi:surface carbohydrate biosynthesis protein